MYNLCRQHGNIFMKRLLLIFLGFFVLSAFTGGLSEEEINKLEKVLQDAKQNTNNLDEELVNAVVSGNHTLTLNLLQRGADPNAKDKISDENIIFFAAKVGDWISVKLLVKYHAKVNITNDIQKTPLHYSATKGDYLSIEELILNGLADPNVQDMFGKTPLIYAVKNKRYEAAKTLLFCHAKVDFKDAHGKVPLIYAFDLNDYDMVDILAGGGANVNIAYDSENTLFYKAILNKNYKMAEILAKHGADVDKSYIGGSSPLILAVMMQDTNMVKELIKLGANVNLPDSAGYTPLMMACRYNNYDIVKALVEEGKVDVNLTSKGGKIFGVTAAKLAKERGYERIYKYLIGNGASKIKAIF